MNLFDGLEKLINEHGSAAILKERIALLKDQYSALEAKVTNSQRDALVSKNEASISKAEAENLKAQRDALQRELDNLQREKNQFHEFNGLLWQKSGNGFEKTPYCKECKHHPSMFGQPPGMNPPVMWQCNAGHVASFSGFPK